MMTARSEIVNYKELFLCYRYRQQLTVSSLSLVQFKQQVESPGT